MTFYEHAMVGIDGALALGLHRRWGWPIVALAAFESMLPDWDGLTLCFGPRSYDAGHRIWGHSLLVGGVVAAVTAVAAWRGDVFVRLQRALARRWNLFDVKADPCDAASQSWRIMLVWIAVGVTAAWVHLAADCLFSVGRDLPAWGIPLGWPFSPREFAWPAVRWGDVGPTVILAGSMFAMVRWPRQLETIAALTLTLLAAYIGVRGWAL